MPRNSHPASSNGHTPRSQRLPWLHRAIKHRSKYAGYRHRRERWKQSREYHYDPFWTYYGSKILRGAGTLGLRLYWNSDETGTRSAVPYILTGASCHVLLGGYFKCTLETPESTGACNYCRALTELVRGLSLTDTWQGNNFRKFYTHYSVSGVTRFNRIYATQEFLARKLVVEAIVAPFTYHLAVADVTGGMENGQSRHN